MVFGIGEGKIDIVLGKNSFHPGDTIKGKLILELNSPKKAKELRVSIVGERKVYRRGKRKTETVYRAPVVLGREKEYKSGEYDFEIAVPDMKHGQAPDGIAGELVKAASFIGGPTPVRWYLDAALDIPMSMDISKKLDLNII
jgi:hypothetical protein